MLLGCPVPVDFQEYAGEAEEISDLLADNRIAELAEMDEKMLAELFAVIDESDLSPDIAGYTDDESDLVKLGEFIGGLKNAKALDVLPYHTMGVSKYAELGIKYRLEGMPALSRSDAAAAKQKILMGIRNSRNKKETC